MRMSRRDQLATLLVGAGLVIYVLRLAGRIEVRDPAAVAAVLLALGIIASASAVVPGFTGLIHGSRAYMVAASAGGVVALGGGVAAILWASEVGLAVLALATLALWAAATLRHAGAHDHEATAA